MSGHTKGPWKFDDEVGCKRIAGNKSSARRQAQYDDVAFTVGLSDEERDRANASLIAAAPDLLAFVRHLVEAVDEKQLEMNSPEIGEPENDIPLHPWHEEWLHYARAAINKAEGR